ncbi:MAG: phosphate signaling complex protein PhoU [Defluviitaleaceae bacterium]|nr:phosphate signaling complex protein PhoU [Defluviitaleaceae bacterium]
MRAKFDEQLAELNNTLIEMAGLAERAIADAAKALVTQDTDLAEEIIAFDDRIDSMENEIENMCLKLILRQQPVASDLRMVSSILKMIADLERIGDHAGDISELTLLLADKQYIKKLEHIPQMADAAMKMVTDSIDAFVRRDLKLANKVIDYDDVVDDLFVTVRDELIVLINENPKNGDQAMDFLMIAKYLERIGDHATNIAEWVVFSITGTHRKHQAASL